MGWGMKQSKPAPTIASQPSAPSTSTEKSLPPNFDPLLALICSSGFVSNDYTLFDAMFDDRIGRV
jgi:hypothetical protein